MIKQVVGEDLKAGAVLTWAGGFDYQSKFFIGSVDPVSTFASLLRYDIEVSGFGSPAEEETSVGCCRAAEDFLAFPLR